MGNNSIGASIISRKNFSCEITEITCQYESDKTNKEIVLYKKNEEVNNATITPYSSTQVNTIDYEAIGLGLYGAVTNRHLYKNFPFKQINRYIITNHKGVTVKIKNTRIANDCTDPAHQLFTIGTYDIHTHQKKEIEERPLDNGNIKILYYNLFESIKEKYKSIFRLFCLPVIDSSNNLYYSTMLRYRTCSNQSKQPVPDINIISYPDISFKFIFKPWGYKSESNTYNKEKADKVTKTNFNISLSANYASVEDSIEFGKETEYKDNDKNGIEGRRLYTTLSKISNFFKEVANLTNDINDTYKKCTRDKEGLSTLDSIAKGNSSLSNFTKPNANTFLKGSIEIEPTIEFEWGYSVSDDLEKLGRLFSLLFSLKVTGKIVLDLLKMAQNAIVATATGVAPPIYYALNWLLNTVIPWLEEKFADINCYFYLKGSAQGDFKLKVDTCKEKKLGIDPVTVTLKIALGLTVSVKAKSTIVITIEIEGKLQAEISAFLKLKFSIKEDKSNTDKKKQFVLGTEIGLNPGKITISYSILASHEKTGKNFNKSNEKTFELPELKSEEKDHILWTF